MPTAISGSRPVSPRCRRAVEPLRSKALEPQCSTGLAILRCHKGLAILRCHKGLAILRCHKGLAILRCLKGFAIQYFGVTRAWRYLSVTRASSLGEFGILTQLAVRVHSVSSTRCLGGRRPRRTFRRRFASPPMTTQWSLSPTSRKPKSSQTKDCSLRVVGWARAIGFQSREASATTSSCQSLSQAMP